MCCVVVVCFCHELHQMPVFFWVMICFSRTSKCSCKVTLCPFKMIVIVAFCDLNIVRWRSHNLIPRCTNVQRENGLQCFAKTWGSILSYTPSAPTLLSYFLQTLLSIHFPSPWAQHYPISTFNFLHFPSSCHLLSSPVYYIFSTGPWASEFLLCERSLNEA